MAPGQPTVLIIDDEPAFRRLVAFSLKTIGGMHVLIAHNGPEGVATAERHQPDLVLLDVLMPGMDGPATLTTLRGSPATAVIPVAFMTAKTDRAELDTLKAMGVCGVLRKPIDPTTLPEQVRALLGPGSGHSFAPRTACPPSAGNAAIAKARSTDREVATFLVWHGGTLRFESRPELASDVADYLVRETGQTFDAADQAALQLGLVELLLNAIEHGNLAITYEEKTRALEQPAGLRALYAERRASPVLADRCVSVDFEMTSDEYTWVITDEGSGFDWRRVSDPLEGSGRLATHGRGLFLARLQFDVLEYQGSGNVVRAVKRANQTGP